MLFNSAAFQAFSLELTTNGAGALLIGLSAAAFFDLRTGLGGGNITNRRSSTTGWALAFGIVEVTEMVVEEPDVEVCNFAGKGFPGAFLKLGFLANDGLTIFGERLAIFFAAFLGAGFLATAFFATFLAGFFAAGFELFFDDFLNNFLIATLPPEGGKVMAWPN
jgi:hypothetical protein